MFGMTSIESKILEGIEMVVNEALSSFCFALVGVAIVALAVGFLIGRRWKRK